jgi:hypothetical protein
MGLPSGKTEEKISMNRNYLKSRKKFRIKAEEEIETLSAYFK